MAKQSCLFVGYWMIILLFLLSIVGGSRAVTAMVETIPIPRKHTIIIDAGHGGIDGGATSCTRKLESSFNLEIAMIINDLFHFLGYDTKMIRTTDISIYTKGDTISQQKISDLKERVRIVNETPNALLLSIHQNNFSDSRYSGAQVFYGKEEGSAALAEALQSTLVSTLNPGSRRQSKRSEGIYLMEQIQCPGVLVECGFLSNPQEEARLRSKGYQQKLACVLVSQIGKFLSNT